MKITAETRTVVKPNHAVITPDGYVNSVIPGWDNCEINVIISPEMGARFVQQLITLNSESQGSGETQETEVFFFLLEGSCQATVGSQEFSLKTGSYIFVPPQKEYRFYGTADSAKMVTFKKTYVAQSGHENPELIQGDLSKVKSDTYLNDPQLDMQLLLPEDLSFDMAVNVFTYDPGGNLPFVETHIMEHGLIYLAGQGIYRLDNDWYPIKKGDSIWMAPYCPQWFVAMGKEPAVYIYYKDVNRSSL